MRCESSFRALFGILRFLMVGHPGRARRIETVRKLAPGALRSFLIISSTPTLFPKVTAPGLFVSRQIGFVRVDMNLVRVNPHAEFGVTVWQRKEPCFQSHR